MSALLNLMKELDKLRFPSGQPRECGCHEHFTWWWHSLIVMEVSVKANGDILRMPRLGKDC